MKGYLQLRKHAKELLETQLSSKLEYHNKYHTYSVLKNVDKFIRRDKVKEHDAKLLRISALYHDIGFTQVFDQHVDKGIEILKEAMEQYGWNAKDYKIMSGLILATNVPQRPKSMLQKILADSDLYYLGEKDFYLFSDKLYREKKNLKLVKNQKEWDLLQIQFLEAHKFHTPFAKRVLRPKKIQRIEELKRKTKT